MGVAAAAVPGGRDAPTRWASPARRSSTSVGLPAASPTRLRAGPRADRAAPRAADGAVKELQPVVRIDTPQEVAYYQHGGILHYVLRQLAGVA